MVSNRISSLDLTLSFNGTIGEIMSLSGSGRTVNIHEIATVDLDDNCIEKIAGLINEGDVTIHIIYDGGHEGVYNDLNTDFQARNTQTLLITHSDLSTLSCDAIISSLGEPSFGAPGEPIELDVTFARSGKVVYTDKAVG